MINERSKYNTGQHFIKINGRSTGRPALPFIVQSKAVPNLFLFPGNESNCMRFLAVEVNTHQAWGSWRVQFIKIIIIIQTIELRN